MSVLVGKRNDGGISIVHPAPNVEEEIAFNDEVKSQFVSWRIADVSALPVDREWRNAWRDELEGEQIDICMNAAKEVALSKLRVQRDRKLEELDKQTLIALGRGDEVMRQNIETEKQHLRDITTPLKDIVVSGYSDTDTLAQLKQLSTLE